MAFVQGSGTATLSYFNCISFQRVLKASPHRLQRCYSFIFKQQWGNSFSPHPAAFSPGKHTNDWRENRALLNHAITMFHDTVAIINFISHINHRSLTFIVEVMGWSCGLRDSSWEYKCCYLLSLSTYKYSRKEEKTEHSLPSWCEAKN